MNAQPEKLTSTMSYGTSAATGTLSALLHAFSYEEWLIIGVLVGMVFCVLTFFVNVFYQQKRLRLEERRLNLNNRSQNQGCGCE